MSVHRTVKKIGGSLTVVIPRDIAEMMGVDDTSAVRMSLVGRQLVVEPEDDYAGGAEFQRAFGAVLRRESKSFQALADYDSGRRRR